MRERVERRESERRDRGEREEASGERREQQVDTIRTRTYVHAFKVFRCVSVCVRAHVGVQFKDLQRLNSASKLKGNSFGARDSKYSGSKVVIRQQFVIDRYTYV